MKEHPILFREPMVRALLADQKTQTRRAVKQELRQLGDGFWYEFDHKGLNYRVNSRLSTVGAWASLIQFCPYGQPGDRLWVRESFWGCDLPGYGDQPCVVYDDEWHGKEYAPAEARPWGRKFGRIPSIHMPRDCSRITLEIVSVRVERLQDISEADAIAEGVKEGIGDFVGCYFCGNSMSGTTAKECYSRLWEQINGAGAWDANPWVWVVEFRRLP